MYEELTRFITNFINETVYDNSQENTSNEEKKMLDEMFLEKILEDDPTAL